MTFCKIECIISMHLSIAKFRVEIEGGIQSFVRVIHASPDIGTADVFVDSNHLLSNFQFGTVTGYVAIARGPHKVQVGLIGKGPNAAMITQTISVDAAGVYTV